MFTKTLPWLFAAVALLSQACGSSTSTDGPSDAQGDCQIALSGALSGTYACFQSPVAVWTRSGGATILTITSDGRPKKGTLNIASTSSITSVPTIATYTASDPDLYVWSVTIRQETTSMTWGAGETAGVVVAGGDYSLAINSVGAASGGGDSQSYPVHGSEHVRAAADPTSGASGDVTMDVTF